MTAQGICPPLSKPSAVLLAWIERCGLCVLLAMPLMMFLGIAVCDVSIIAVGVLFLLRSCVLNDFSWLRARWLQLGLLLWLYLIAISAHALMSAALSFKEALPFGRFLFFAAGLEYWLLASEKNRRLLVYAMGAALLLIAFDILFTFLTGFSIVGKSAMQYAHYQHITWIWQRPYQRIMGLNGKMNSGIMLTWMSMPFLVAMLLYSVKHHFGWRVVLAALAVMVISTAILVSGERMALLELCLGYALIFVLIKPLRKILVIVGVFCIAMALLVLLRNPGLWSRNVASVLHAIATFSTNNYGNLFKAAWALFLHYPLFGVGLKQYFLISSLPEYASFNAINSHVQNVYLEFLSGAGLIGTLLFLGLLYCWARQFWKRRTIIKASPIALGVLIAFILRVWPFASTTSFFFAWGAITFWWMGAWLLALTREQEK